MARFVARRLLWLIPTIFAISLITFVVMHATPGSPFQPKAGNANPLPPDVLANVEREYGLDKPYWEQYARFMWRAAQFDFGKSFYYRTRYVSDIIKDTLPVSMHLGIMALGLAIVVGIPLGVVAAIRQNSIIDYLASVTAVLGVSLPNFVLAILFMWLFVLVVPIIPRTGGWESPVDWILPTLALGLGPLGILARYTRSSVIEVLNQDFIRTAEAKGLRERQVVIRHVLKNGLIPPLTILGPMFAAITTGSFFVESAFRVPGMGRFFVESMQARDYPMIMAVILLYGVLLAIMNILVDVTYALVDPRIRLS
ncbi:MAG TPA: ABC transporter permease [Thermomicrobiales bacterium]|nr:ABC transporter permease [Thermomicrobiales bacterium]